MKKLIIIADDLTGANATGVLISKLGHEVYTCLDLESSDCIFNSQCVSLPTNSRALPPEEAYKKVFFTCKTFSGKTDIHFCKRIDSTLRGNIGAEIDAMLDALEKDCFAVVVPSFPASGRILKKGLLYVNGVPLHETGISKDPLSPVCTSNCKEIISAQSHCEISSIFLDEYNRNSNVLTNKINNLLSNGSRIIIIDAECQEDIDAIANSVFNVNKPFISVDPGVFTATLAKNILQEPKGVASNTIKSVENGYVLAIIGSVNENARKQFEFLNDNFSCLSYIVNTSALTNDLLREAEIQKVVSYVRDNCDRSHNIIIAGDGLWSENRLNLPVLAAKSNKSAEELSDLINTALAEIAFLLCKDLNYIHTLYTCGGDITLSVCRKLQASLIKLSGEILPLAAYGTIISGPFNGMGIITKGGSQGDEKALAKCLSYARTDKNIFL